MKKVAIIGGGAAGCFCAVALKRNRPDLAVEVIEAGRRPLAKVAVTGGGRCNVTNTFAEVRSLQAVYPRGHRLMQRVLRRFSPADCMAWWEREGVALTVQPDQCVFPASQDAMQVVRTLTRGMRAAGVEVLTGRRVTSIEPLRPKDDTGGATPDGRYRMVWCEPATGQRGEAVYDAVVVTTGGSPKAEGLDFLSPLGLALMAPCPSLFSLTVEGPIRQLMGQVVDPVAVQLAGTNYRAEGPLLITHWGLSGPAILRLSSYAARYLHDCGYRARLVVGWLGSTTEAEARGLVGRMARDVARRRVVSVAPGGLPARLWASLVERCHIAAERTWGELGSAQLNRLASTLVADVYAVSGQSRHKEEFVTAGGVALAEVDMQTLESKKHPGLHVAGEVLDVDGVTGGFNLQAAWSMGWVVAQHLSQC